MAGLTTGGEVEYGPLVPADVPAASALSAGVGWNQDEADWRRLIELHPEGAFAARSAGVLVGTATVVRFGEDLAWVGMVIVREDMRGRGVGGRMVELALAGLAGFPGHVGLDATAYGAPVYVRRGFQSVASVDRWAGRLVAVPGPDALASLREEQDGPGADGVTGLAPGGRLEAGPAHPDDLAALLRLDLMATGFDRSRLLSRLVAEPSTEVFVVRRAGTVVGYGALRSGRQVRHVGPVAGTDPAAREAVLAALGSAARGEEVFLDAPRAAERSRLLTAFGLAPTRTLERMTLPASEGAAMLGEQVVAAMGLEWG